MNLLEKETRGRQRGEAQHEEVQTRERDQGHSQLPQVAVQLTTETQAAGDPGNHGGHQVIPDITADTRWFSSPKVEVVSFGVRKQMSYKASLSMHLTSPEGYK